jgi:hypothetical protein
MSVQAKIGETVPQLEKRFGKNYTVVNKHGDVIGFHVRSEKLNMDVLVQNGASTVETYFSRAPLNANGKPPSDDVRAILTTYAPRWVETDAAPIGADYALQSSDHQYIAAFNYNRPQGFIWDVNVGRAEVMLMPEKQRGAGSFANGSVTPSPPPASKPSFANPPPTPVDRSEQNSTAIPDWARDSAPALTSTDNADSKPAASSNNAAHGMFDDLIPQKGVESLRKAAEQNDATAQDRLGLCYHDGNGVQKNDTEAAKWFRKAADQNFADAQFELGMCYHNGDGVPKDYGKRRSGGGRPLTKITC